LLEKVGDKAIFSLKASDAMVKNPKTIRQDAILDAALAIMERKEITQLPTVDEHGHLAGVIHLHDILKSKLV
jgi:arabinose-5-phosphate isomerase